MRLLSPNSVLLISFSVTFLYFVLKKIIFIYFIIISFWISKCIKYRFSKCLCFKKKKLNTISTLTTTLIFLCSTGYFHSWLLATGAGSCFHDLQSTSSLFFLNCVLHVPFSPPLPLFFSGSNSIKLIWFLIFHFNSFCTYVNIFQFKFNSFRQPFNADFSDTFYFFFIFSDFGGTIPAILQNSSISLLLFFMKLGFSLIFSKILLIWSFF